MKDPFCFALAAAQKPSGQPHGDGDRLTFLPQALWLVAHGLQGWLRELAGPHAPLAWGDFLSSWWLTSLPRPKGSQGSVARLRLTVEVGEVWERGRKEERCWVPSPSIRPHTPQLWFPWREAVWPHLSGITYNRLARGPGAAAHLHLHLAAGEVWGTSQGPFPLPCSCLGQGTGEVQGCL